MINDTSILHTRPHITAENDFYGVWGLTQRNCDGECRKPTRSLAHSEKLKTLNDKLCVEIAHLNMFWTKFRLWKFNWRKQRKVIRELSGSCESGDYQQRYKVPEQEARWKSSLNDLKDWRSFRSDFGRANFSRGCRGTRSSKWDLSLMRSKWQVVKLCKLL